MDTNTNNPGARIIQVWKNMVEAVRFSWDRSKPLVERIRADRASIVAAEELKQLQREAREAFAKSRGWRYNPKRWISDRPVVHHAEFYDDVDGNATGLVTHCYASLEDIASYAADYGMKAEVLPFSWWAPHKATAVLLTLKVGGEWPKSLADRRASIVVAEELKQRERAFAQRKALGARKRAHADTAGEACNSDLA